MSTWVEEYRKKLTTPDKAVGVVKSGDWIIYSYAANTLPVLDMALAQRTPELHDIQLLAGVSMRPHAVVKADPRGEHFTWDCVHFSVIDRKYYEMGRAFYIPLRYSEVPRYIAENISRIDVFMVQVSPMDQHGNFNFGPTISHYPAAAAKAKTVIVEVNEDMPIAHGGYGNYIHISDVDYIVEGGHTGMPQIPSALVTDVDQKIAQYVLDDLRDGDCIQLGIGAMPNALGQMIAASDLKDLGVHTEMLVDSYVDMWEAGRISGRKKQIDKGRMVYTFAGGTQKLYDFINNNPQVAGYPVDYTNDRFIASRNDNLVSINNALEIDLSGQVCSETIGPRMISGAGGQLDFVDAAYSSKGGRSFICMESTFTDAEGKKHSRIRPLLTEGAVVTDTRPMVQYVVTEHGKANLKGATTWQRAERLISLAHPDFREELIQEAEKLKIWRKSNK
ncbi:acetyl-CoA hydrolase/transferase family protein [Desulfitobacterium chlororespirans]|uniref:Probable butyrate:acetyl-CoA coenzyme A-transferase n=1 Tax=Desulfitobacterium chlororespirans DSM 11544 TaxID=1121395 RepID=A0A1M7U9Y5_9FIRM|nr:acetyl-CoA hydrolase/transferase C-terminal domain-containing protein [Desulfitobacterium chlororespirans]SHN79736.1 butyryl-CoA:acetate CoA-transferase [Desulfitobacterium chlororespirans DSM 11544]